MFKRSVTIIGILLLLLGVLALWRLIVRATPPPTPKTFVTIPEGFTVSKINALLQKEGVLVGEELPRNLEGYLFPDTYEFFLDSTAEVVAGKFMANLGAQLETLGVSLEDGDVGEILTLASILEGEIKDLGEMRIASGVLGKRLKAGIPLQADATLCYLKESRGQECLPIIQADKAIDSPYNTYLHKGLPPRPINNPGLGAIKAALDPANSPYLYYVSDPETGRTVFSKTLDEHNQNVIKYLRE